MYLSKHKCNLLAMVASLSIMSSAQALTLEDAIRIAVKSNPEILQSLENREAVEFELQQARGAFMPTLDLESNAGVRKLDNASRRSLGIQNKQLNPADVGLTLRQSLFDGGTRKAELNRQASRVDGASYRALERTEIIALSVAREYLEYLLQTEVVKLTRRNLQQIGSITSGIDIKIQNDVLTRAEGSLARERQQSARVRSKEAQQELIEASVRFERLVGLSISNAKLPRSRKASLPKTLAGAVALATQNSPRVAFANTDIQAAQFQVDSARAEYLPKVDFEARARYGSDIDGAAGTSTNMEAKVVARWNLFRGGRDTAVVQERIRRAGEAKYGKDIILRETVELVKSAWNRRTKQAERAQELKRQANINASLVSDYKEQFDLDRRSLLDVLSAQNTRFNSEISTRTSAYASLFAEYELLAAIGNLNKVIGYDLPDQATSYAREEFKVVSRIGNGSEFKRLPSRQVAGKPFDLLTPLNASE